MFFKDVIGNEPLKEKLISMVDEGRVGHSIMLVERGGYGALPIALSLVQYISCPSKKVYKEGDIQKRDSCGECPSCRKISKLIHPDLHFVFPVNMTPKSGADKKVISDNFISEWRNIVLENPYFTEDMLNRELGIDDKVGTISVAQAKDIFAKMNMRPYEGDKRYMIIWLPERMTVEAANRLLKIVEEPFPGTYFIFISQSPEKVIDTIRSRCLVIPILPIDTDTLTKGLEDKFKISPDDAYAFARGSNGSFGVAAGAILSDNDNAKYLQMTSNLFEGCISRNLLSVISVNNEIVELGRERQKEFCMFAQGYMRKILMAHLGIESVSYCTSSEKEKVLYFSSRLSQSFLEKGFTYFDNARIAVEGNGNAKMIFYNLGNLLFLA